MNINLFKFLLKLKHFFFFFFIETLIDWKLCHGGSLEGSSSWLKKLLQTDKLRYCDAARYVTYRRYRVGVSAVSRYRLINVPNRSELARTHQDIGKIDSATADSARLIPSVASLAEACWLVAAQVALADIPIPN